MAALQKLVVLVEEDRIVGLQALPVGAPPRVGMPEVVAHLAAGPTQTRHEVMAAMPASFKNDAARQRFHATLLAQVKAQAKG